MSENEYIILILKHLNKETTPEEEAVLEHWLAADPVNRQEFEGLARVWGDSAGMLQGQKFDIAAAWAKVDPYRANARNVDQFKEGFDVADPNKVGVDKAELDNVELPEIDLRNEFPNNRSKIRGMSRRVLMAAACVGIVAVAGVWYFGGNRSGALEQVEAKADQQSVGLGDGSTVILRKGARLRYPAVFEPGNRKVELQGEAFFQVAHEPGRGFTVSTPHSIIEDIGTSFWVRDKGEREDVVVASGKIKLTDRNDLSNSFVMSPGEKAILKEHNPIQHIEHNGSENYLAWQTGVLDFRGTPLDQVMQDLSDLYMVPIVLSSELRQDTTIQGITARFEHQPLDQVLEEIRLTTGLRSVHQKDTILFIRR